MELADTSPFIEIRPAGPLATGYRLGRDEASRWSGEAWLLARRGASPAPGVLAPSYGGSQAGGILRYRLDGDSMRRPVAYARISRSLAQPSTDTELAIGVAARPLPQIPVMMAAEGRVRHAGERTDARAAVLAWTELPPVDLPLGFDGTAYMQGGYVTGRDATGFVDGQVRIDREIVSFGNDRVTVRAGAAGWGGAQQGASRVDIGPSATIRLDTGKPDARVAFDWRFRVAGDAAPQSGPAMTVSIGF